MRVPKVQTEVQTAGNTFLPHRHSRARNVAQLSNFTAPPHSPADHARKRRSLIRPFRLQLPIAYPNIVAGPRVPPMRPRTSSRDRARAPGGSAADDAAPAASV